LSRKLLNLGFGSDGQKGTGAYIPDSNLVLYERVEGKEGDIATEKNQQAALKKAQERIKGIKGSHIVVFSREAARRLENAMATGNYTEYNEYIARDKNITVVPDQYLDLTKGSFPDLLARMAIGRNIAYYYTAGTDDARMAAIKAIRALLERITADAGDIVDIVDNTIRFKGLLKIKPAYKDIAGLYDMLQQVESSM